MNRRIRVLELCCSPHKGGLELYYADICNALHDHFEVVQVVGKGSAISSLLQHGPVFELQKRAHYLPLMAAKRLAAIIDEYEVDIIHLHWNHDLTLAVFARLLSKTRPKIVLTRHMKFPSRKDGFFHRFLYRNIACIMAITQTMAHDLKRFIPQDVQPEIVVNYLGVPPMPKADLSLIRQRRQEYDPEGSAFLIALVGRIDYDKGHEFLLDALMIAKNRGLPFKALIVGQPMRASYLETLKEKVKSAGLEQQMIFTGFVHQPRELMQACDVLVLPTIEETFGLVLIEAMSVGVPVVGSNRGGVPEIITDGQTGLLFESTNSQSLFDALFSLYESPENGQRYANQALGVVQTKFSADKHIQRLTETLKEIAHG